MQELTLPLFAIATVLTVAVFVLIVAWENGETVKRFARFVFNELRDTINGR